MKWDIEKLKLEYLCPDDTVRHKPMTIEDFLKKLRQLRRKAIHDLYSIDDTDVQKMNRLNLRIETCNIMIQEFDSSARLKPMQKPIRK